jgi:DGQHR domain-containing protein
MIPAIKIMQNDRPILIFSMSAIDLKNISYFNPRELDRDDGIQRPYKEQRSKDIAAYIDTEESVLANDIIVNIELEKNGLELKDIYDEKNNAINDKLLKTKSSTSKKIAFVIDGQHRLRAFEYSTKKDYPLVVAALIDLSLAEVAELFVKINYYQKPVNKSLVLDLLGISADIFPQYYILHNVVLKLNEDIASPFYQKIKMLGLGKGYISQASIISSIEKYKIEKTLRAAGIKPSEEILFNVIWNYFSAVENVFESYWGSDKLLSKTIGIRALFRVLQLILQNAVRDKKTFSKELIERQLKKINQDIFISKEVKGLGGEKGVKLLSDKMIEELGAKR